MIRTLLAAGLVILVAGPALALSCLAPTVQRSFAVAQDSPATYVLAVGMLTPLPGEAAPPDPTDPNQRQGHVLRTRFEGVLASGTGFNVYRLFDVAVEVGCLGPWCGGLPRGETLLFLERRADGHVLTAGPCGQFAFAATPEVKTQALACLQGGDCTAP
ncbi:hypothetical protein [Jannaschia sp. M317]|uniref:hypothetical protein n=1 Tax=Jannaschia sp. M317 TaxID=2867011 RepID=UPI0021A56541|nr:hypothetical protein [Jannaschia sp. M317]UWQ18210.1 hypothetical protein K3551_02560 [Jannaschia sp. M317]